MIYLASPYMHESPAVKQLRHDLAVEAAIDIMRSTGEAVFSPIAHSHYMHVRSGGDIGGDRQQWQEFDRVVIGACSAFVILKIDGWETSHGIGQETMIARALGIPITYREPMYA